MITPQKITARYRSIEPYLEPLRQALKQTVHVFSDRLGLATSSRIKTLESIAEKIETGRFSSWSELDDLVAMTIVVPTLLKEEEVITFLRAAFEEVSLKRRGSTQKAPEVFRFDSTRFVGRLRRREGDDSEANLTKIKFEIQIKSAFEHAWGVTTHALTYKGRNFKWNRLRLTAQLKAAVEQLDILVIAFEEASLKIDQSIWPEIEAKEKLKDFFQSCVDRGLLAEELTPKDWTRFCDNVFNLAKKSTRDVKNKPVEMVALISEAVEAELMALGADQVPRSLSLWQLTFGVLCKKGLLRTPRGGFWPVITPELEALYPMVSDFKDRFDYSS